MSSSTERVERRLAAIFCADVADYSRLMRDDEVQTLRTLTGHRAIMDGLIAAHGGRIANTAGDSVLAEFPSVVDAVECAVAVQKKLGEENAGVPEDKVLRFRIGVHVGDVMVRGGDLLGDGVNVAARIQVLAQPGGICLSEEAHRYARSALAFTFTDLGLQTAKNIPGGVRAFALHTRDNAELRVGIGQPKHVREPPSVAVLPFENLSDQQGDTYFSDGMTEEIIIGLARFRSLLVVARNSSFSFRDESLDVAEIARRLNVSYLVQGSIRRGGDRIRVTAQLIQAGTGARLWAERYDRKIDDVFAVQDEVAQMIASTLFGRIEDATLKQALQKPTGSAAAYDFVLRGLAHLRGYAPEDNQRACEMFEQAIQLDPEYALAHAYVALVRVALDGYAAASPTVLDRSFERAAMAADLDPQESRCHRMLGLICLFRREHETAERHFQRALELNPNDADGMQQMGYLLALRGRPECALKHMDAARRLNPFHPTWYNHSLGIALYSLRRYGEAAQAFARLPYPGPWTRARLAACLAQLEKHADAKAQTAAVLAARSDFSTSSFLERDVLLERHEDREHLRAGLRKAGLPE